MHRRLALVLVAAIAGVAPATPAFALQFGSSSSTGKQAMIIPFQTGGWLAGTPVGMDLGIRIIPGLNDLLPAPAIAAGSAALGYSMLIDAELALKYNIKLADLNFGPLGRFNPALVPYVGYRHLVVPGVEGSASLLGGVNSTVNLSQFGGVSYGIKAVTELPLGFKGYAGLGATTMMSGSFDQRKNGLAVTNSGKIAPGSMTLPGLSFGASWGFPLFEVSVGYELFRLPSGLQSLAPTLSADQTTFNNLNVGVRLLTFSI